MNFGECFDFECAYYGDDPTQTPAALNEAAARRTGLEEQAPDELVEPLELLCEDLGRHPPTDLGAVMVWTSLVQALANRRRIQAQWGLDEAEVRDAVPGYAADLWAGDALQARWQTASML